MRKHILYLASLILSILSIAAQGLVPGAGTAKTGSGLVSPVLNKSGDVFIYKGIPYAAAPVGNLRWKAPQPVASRTGVRKCDSFAPSAMQGNPVPFMMYTTEFLIPAEPISEDCLYLNLWAPVKSTTKRPVIVWIHGGAFVSGSGSCPLYDGEELARKGVLLVTINYRLGVFGFLAHPALSSESSTHSSGNYASLI